MDTLPALVALVSHRVLFTRKHNENLTSAHDPVGPYVEGEVDLDAEGSFCWSPDDDRHVTGKLYEVRDIPLPEFLSPAEWARNAVAWKYTWGAGVDPTWPEAWQRGLKGISDMAARMAAAKLLKTKKFRSPFRESLRDQLVAWLDTPVEARTYGSPFSFRQWERLIDTHIGYEAKCTGDALYYSRSHNGAPVPAVKAAKTKKAA